MIDAQFWKSLLKMLFILKYKRNQLAIGCRNYFYSYNAYFELLYVQHHLIQVILDTI